MIITDSDNKAAVASLPSSSATVQLPPPPPAYEPPTESSPLYTRANVKPPRRTESATRRFFKALLLAFILVDYFSGVFAGAFFVIRRHYDRRHRSGNWPSPPPSHGTIIKCETNWGEQTQTYARSRQHSRSFSPPPSPLPIPEYPGHPNSVHKSFTLSKSSKRLYFLTQGQRQRVTGSIKFEPAQGTNENDDDVKVDVEAYSAQSGALGSLGICTLGDESGQGIGIYTSDEHRESEHPEWAGTIVIVITVHIPISTNASSPSIKSLMTKLPFFEHSIANFVSINPNFHFDDISLNGNSSPMFMDGLAARNISILTTNAPIMGRVLSDGGVRLETSNALVDVDVELFGRGAEDDDNGKTKLDVVSKNGPITSRIQLSRHHPSSSPSHKPYPGTHGSFSINATTSSHPLNILFPLAPAHSHLALVARTSNALANVILHRSFEGELAAASDNGGRIEESGSAVDPSGMGRAWNLEQREMGRGGVRGEAWFDDGNRYRGKVDVGTSGSGDCVIGFVN